MILSNKCGHTSRNVLVIVVAVKIFLEKLYIWRNSMCLSRVVTWLEKCVCAYELACKEQNTIPSIQDTTQRLKGEIGSHFLNNLIAKKGLLKIFLQECIIIFSNLLCMSAPLNTSQCFSKRRWQLHFSIQLHSPDASFTKHVQYSLKHVACYYKNEKINTTKRQRSVSLLDNRRVGESTVYNYLKQTGKNNKARKRHVCGGVRGDF